MELTFSGAITAAPIAFIGAATANVAQNQQLRTARLLDRIGKGLAVPVTRQSVPIPTERGGSGAARTGAPRALTARFTANDLGSIPLHRRHDVFVAKWLAGLVRRVAPPSTEGEEQITKLG